MNQNGDSFEGMAGSYPVKCPECFRHSLYKSNPDNPTTTHICPRCCTRTHKDGRYIAGHDCTFCSRFADSECNYWRPTGKDESGGCLGFVPHEGEALAEVMEQHPHHNIRRDAGDAFQALMNMPEPPSFAREYMCKPIPNENGDSFSSQETKTVGSYGHELNTSILKKQIEAMLFPHRDLFPKLSLNTMAGAMGVDWGKDGEAANSVIFFDSVKEMREMREKEDKERRDDLYSMQIRPITRMNILDPRKITGIFSGTCPRCNESRLSGDPSNYHTQCYECGWPGLKAIDEPQPAEPEPFKDFYKSPAWVRNVLARFRSAMTSLIESKPLSKDPELEEEIDSAIEDLRMLCEKIRSNAEVK